MLHPEQSLCQSNISAYLGQSRMQSQRRRAAASVPGEGNTWGLFQPEIQSSLLLRASQRHTASSHSPITLVLLLPKIVLFICEQPQLEPGVFAKLVPLYHNPGSEKHPQ